MLKTNKATLARDETRKKQLSNCTVSVQKISGLNLGSLTCEALSYKSYSWKLCCYESVMIPPLLISTFNPFISTVDKRPLLFIYCAFVNLCAVFQIE